MVTMVELQLLLYMGGGANATLVWEDPANYTSLFEHKAAIVLDSVYKCAGCSAMDCLATESEVHGFCNINFRVSTMVVLNGPIKRG